mmetsp:Transcript_55625/g.161165  ORF Transcript_55625/g.161165 Transcript_55625/m.161165 type:complete len:373 (+) Transcript_55625:91-1209(+)
MSDEWCTIESDPGVFTQLCEEVGVKGVQFDEVYDLEPGAFLSFDAKRIFGLVFLFKWQQEATSGGETVDAADHGVFFAQQVIQNACATQAILSVLLNAPAELDLGPHLKEFKEFTAALDPQMKGLAISNSEPVRKAHNSFRQQSSFEIVNEKDEKGDDAFHFVSYICHEGKVYELDGLKKGPVLIGDAPPGDTAWAEKAREEVKRRIEAYAAKAGAGADSSGELRFQLMAVVGNRILEAEKAIERERYLRQRANISLVSRGEEVELADEVDDDDAPADIPTFEELSERDLPALKALVADCTTKISELSAQIDVEKKKRQKWEKENALRRCDLVPLALCAMRHLARTGQLVPAMEKGKAAHLKRVEEKKAAAA